MRFSTLQSGTLFLSVLSFASALPKPSIDLRAINNVNSTIDKLEVLHDGYVPPGYKPAFSIPGKGSAEAFDTKQPDVLVSRGKDYQPHHSSENSELPASMAYEIENNTLNPRSGIGAGELVTEGITGVVKGIMDGIESDNKGREVFTQSTVSYNREKYPAYNWVVVHPQHEIYFDGVKGQDWGHQHHEYDIKIGGTIGYEIYWFTSGKFKRFGDGGFINWAYGGNVTNREDEGATVTFIAPVY